jgi:hypothetical protein
MTPRHRRIRLLRKWHRWCGILAALWLVLLVGTGWLVNHSDALDLAHRAVSAPWLLRWYGLNAQAPKAGFLADAHWLAGNEEHWVLDGRLLDVHAEQPIGLVLSGNLLFAASERHVRIYTLSGQLVDQLDTAALPVKRVARIGRIGSQAVIEGDGAVRTSDGMTWQPYKGNAAWSEACPIPAALRAAWAGQFAASLPLERILLDLHSGHILGHGGPWLLDAVGLLLMILALSGAWVFFLRH